jgi:uncharacterized repeat protein (TIGR03803 family)
VSSHCEIRQRLFAVCGVALAICGSGIARANGAAKVLYAFQGGSDGAHPPAAGLITDDTGDLFGVTSGGGGGTDCQGDNGCGTVFELAPDGSEVVLHAFAGGCDGTSPTSRLTVDGSGNFYGVTGEGGSCNDEGFGTVFKLAPGGAESVVYAFKGGTDGEEPSSALVSDRKGDLFGTTPSGGNGAGCPYDTGCGTLFEVKPNGKKAILYSFCSQTGCMDGAGPGGILRDNAGNFFGVAGGGGGTDCSDGTNGCGTVFELAAGGTETVLYAFSGGSDGAFPVAGLLADKAGNFYGTTETGGSANRGTVFKLAPGGTETVLYSFQGGSDGEYPDGILTADKAGNLYGTTGNGGGARCKGNGCGTVFKLSPDGTETVLNAFTHGHGQFPAGALLLGKHDELYGTTESGGKNGDGVVFSVTTK